MRNEVIILLNTFEKIKKFSKVVEKFEFDVDVLQGRYVVNAKSTLGIYTLDFLSPMTVKAYTQDLIEIKSFSDAMEEFR